MSDLTKQREEWSVLVVSRFYLHLIFICVFPRAVESTLYTSRSCQTAAVLGSKENPPFALNGGTTEYSTVSTHSPPLQVNLVFSIITNFEKPL